MKNGEPSIFNPAIYLTFSRFLLVPVFIYFFLIENFTYAVIVLIIASITDVTDGLLARKFNMGTKLGSVLDPLADKFLMMISFIVLSAQGVLPAWLALIVIGRDFYIVFGLVYIYYLQRVNVTFKPTILSKRTTFFQFLLLAFSFIKVYLEVRQPGWEPLYKNIIFNSQYILIYVTAILTLITFIQYTQIGVKMLKYGERRGSNT